MRISRVGGFAAMAVPFALIPVALILIHCDSPVANPAPPATGVPPKALEGMKFIPGGLHVLHGFRQTSDSEKLADPAVMEISAFYMDSTEVTQDRFAAVLGRNPSFNLSGDSPVHNVSWADAILYCNARSKAAGLDTVYAYDSISFDPSSGTRGYGITTQFNVTGYRLPTEPEWERAYGANGGGFYWTSANFGDYAWYDENGQDIQHPVARKLPNGFGLYDMAGNVREYTNDFYDPGYWNALLSATPKPRDPPGPPRGTEILTKGGSYTDSRETLAMAYQIHDYCSDQSCGNFTGFRTMLRVPESKAP